MRALNRFLTRLLNFTSGFTRSHGTMAIELVLRRSTHTSGELVRLEGTIFRYGKQESKMS